MFQGVTLGTARALSRVMSERKTVEIKILTGYVPEFTPKHSRNYFVAIFAAFWELTK